ncbi:MAG: galactose-1-phosphate uridylyltransferase [Candidatus Omnitrophica bacterium CG11_big_fil_rev_8_21_14_0_20_42_13]|uniref:Galactose-1-phosphate uridylyltransferase n=1 Tax=Candidatus Ghiorseimicrobium undicola TaxID=1974746 RepID=A0A2H0LYA5_9BACT|nr:MAG: galactose-1-phosphate uridylyltransferase [Candidatus Omnitrophica bacterium CG11_big_fil_rev_8_21_14_0_20_42_13]
MAQLRRDPIGGRWVIVNTEHPMLPDDFIKEEHKFKPMSCPFCPGNEHMTPPEVDVIRDENTMPNSPGWHIRAVPNKFPALIIEGDLDRRGFGIYDMSHGVGAHEVIAQSPQHDKEITDLEDGEVMNMLSMYCRRSIDLANDKRFKYIMIFKNYGPSAGASLEHPHTQLIALPMIPKNVLEELKGACSYFHYKDRCIFCDILRQEINDKDRIIVENKYFVALCPYVSRFPFEVWIMPKKHNGYFCHATHEELPEMAGILKNVLARVKAVLSNPAYNYIIHTTPVNTPDMEEGYHWHIEIMPKLTRIAGFEWGTGFYMVSTPPEIAARYLREAKI